MWIRIQLYNTEVWGLNFVKVIYLNSCCDLSSSGFCSHFFPHAFFLLLFSNFYSWIRIEEGPCGAGSTIHSPAFLISLHTMNKQINKTKFIFLFPNPGPTKKLQIRWKIRIFFGRLPMFCINYGKERGLKVLCVCAGIPRNGLPDPQHGCVRTPRSCAGNSTCPAAYSCVREACLQQCAGTLESTLLEKNRGKLKFQHIFTHGVEWKSYIVDI